ncbi:MAG: hypothetical protein GX934_02435 [Burkholderiales bacterium]|nr:hypothetical protein [Burkholderiales bacterium]
MTRCRTLRIVILALTLAGWFVFALPAGARTSDPDAIEAIAAIHAKSIRITSFQADFNLLRQGEKFLEKFFPDSPFYDNLSLNGIVNFDASSGQYNMYFRLSGADYHHFALRGNAVTYLGAERIYNLMSSDPTPIRLEPSPSPSASPEGDSSPSPSASPQEEPSPSPTPSDAITDLDPVTKVPVPRHPLLFLWPYSLHPSSQTYTYTVVSRDEIVYGRKCLRIQVTPRDSQNPFLIWVDPKDGVITQVLVTDSRTDKKIRTTYSGFHPPDPKTGFTMYSRAQVDVEDQPLFLVVLSNLVINPKKIMITHTVQGHASPVQRTPAPDTGLGPAVQVLTRGLVVLVSILALCLAILGYRYFRFAVSRQEFSDELLVIDEEDGRFTELMNDLGYAVAPFNAEILTQERMLLGKGATADTTRRPRGLLVAPNSFAEAKSHFYLVRAFVEEGGRVLVMYHSPRSAAGMPFTASFLPMSSSDIATEYVAKSGLFRSISDDDVARLAGSLAAPELYNPSNQRPPIQEFLIGRNKSTGVKGVVIGMIRQGKGEYILCQMKFEPELVLNSAPVRRVLSDLVLFLQARKPAREDEASSLT